MPHEKKNALNMENCQKEDKGFIQISGKSGSSRTEYRPWED